MKTLGCQVRGTTYSWYSFRRLELDLEHCGSLHMVTWPTLTFLPFHGIVGWLEIGELSMIFVFFGLEKVTTDDHNLPMMSVIEINDDPKILPLKPPVVVV